MFSEHSRWSTNRLVLLRQAVCCVRLHLLRTLHRSRLPRAPGVWTGPRLLGAYLFAMSSRQCISSEATDRPEEGSASASDGRDEVARLRREALRHVTPIRMTSHVHARYVERVLNRNLKNERAEEGDVVSGATATGPTRVPYRIDTVRPHDSGAVQPTDPLKASPSTLLSARDVPTVQIDDQWKRGLDRVWWHVKLPTAQVTTVLHPMLK